MAYWVSGWPFGCTIVNDTFTGLPAGIGADGVKPEMWLTPAALTGGSDTCDDPDPQPRLAPVASSDSASTGHVRRRVRPLREEVEAVRRDQPAQLDHDL